MGHSRFVVVFMVFGMAILMLSACGGGSVSINDIPQYPGAVELKAGDSTIGSTLSKNMEQDAAMRKTMGVGGKTEQKGFKLPADTKWDDVKSFYEKELKSRGWEGGIGGVAGNMVDVNAVMNQSNKGNDSFQINIWSKKKQNLSVVMIGSPAKKGQKELLLSLSTR